jgi:hypothetical protein
MTVSAAFDLLNAPEQVPPIKGIHWLERDPKTERSLRWLEHLGFILPVIHFSTRAMKRKLGTDGKRLYIRLTDGRELSADPSQLAYTNRLILYCQYTLPLQGGKQQALYAPGEVDAWIAPLLRQSRKLTEMQALKQQLKSWF